MNAVDYLNHKGAAAAHAYVTQRAADTRALQSEIDVAVDGGAKRGRYQRTQWPECVASLYQGQVFVAFNWDSPHPFTVIEGTTYHRVKTEAQVLAYILARFW